MIDKRLIYPLEEVMRVKERRVEEAERQLQLRQKELEKEQEKLREAEKAREQG